MPELRMVVLATQEKLAYGQTFEEAMSSLFGEAAKPPTESKQLLLNRRRREKQSHRHRQRRRSQTLQQLVTRAIQEFEDYQRLTSQGKLAEAGQKLEQHKRTLEEIQQTDGKQL